MSVCKGVLDVELLSEKELVAFILRQTGDAVELDMMKAREDLLALARLAAVTPLPVSQLREIISAGGLRHSDCNTKELIRERCVEAVKRIRESKKMMTVEKAHQAVMSRLRSSNREWRLYHIKFIGRRLGFSLSLMSSATGSDLWITVTQINRNDIDALQAGDELIAIEDYPIHICTDGHECQAYIVERLTNGPRPLTITFAVGDTRWPPEMPSQHRLAQRDRLRRLQTKTSGPEAKQTRRSAPKRQPLQKRFDRPKSLESTVDAQSEQNRERPAAARAAEPEIERPPVRSVERKFERPAVRSGERKFERPVGRSVERPVERPVAKPVERAVEPPIDGVVERTAERPVERSVERPVERHAERPVKRPNERPVERPAERPVQRHVEEPIKRGAEQPSQNSRAPHVEQSEQQPSGKKDVSEMSVSELRQAIADGGMSCAGVLEKSDLRKLAERAIKSKSEKEKPPEAAWAEFIKEQQIKASAPPQRIDPEPEPSSLNEETAPSRVVLTVEQVAGPTALLAGNPADPAVEPSAPLPAVSPVRKKKPPPPPPKQRKKPPPPPPKNAASPRKQQPTTDENISRTQGGPSEDGPAPPPPPPPMVPNSSTSTRAAIFEAIRDHQHLNKTPQKEKKDSEMKSNLMSELHSALNNMRPFVANELEDDEDDNCWEDEADFDIPSMEDDDAASPYLAEQPAGSITVGANKITHTCEL